MFENWGFLFLPLGFRQAAHLPLPRATLFLELRLPKWHNTRQKADQDITCDATFMCLVDHHSTVLGEKKVVLQLS